MMGFRIGSRPQLHQSLENVGKSLFSTLGETLFLRVLLNKIPHIFCIRYISCCLQLWLCVSILVYLVSKGFENRFNCFQRFIYIFFGVGSGYKPVFPSALREVYAFFHWIFPHLPILHCVLGCSRPVISDLFFNFARAPLLSMKCIAQLTL